MLKAIIFDMDWVLADSTESIRKSFAKIFEKYWVDISQWDKRKYLWRALKDQLDMLKEEYHVQRDIPVKEFSDEAFQYELEFMKDKLHPDPEIQNFIQEAKEKWNKIAVATSSSRRRAKIMLDLLGVSPLLDAFITCEDVEKSKPDPAIFLKAAETLGIQPQDCIVVEDAVNGIQAAQAGGMKSAGKIWPEQTREELSIADIVFSDFSEISISDLENIF